MHAIKIARAARLCALSRYPRTWYALMDRVPASVMVALTAAQLAELAQALHEQYRAGHDAGWTEAGL